jgi:predicted nucleic acid-binding protein
MSDADHVFVDTNILVYAHDRAAGPKHERAREGVRSLWQRPLPPSLSVQILQELYVNLVRKGAAAKVAREVVLDYMHWSILPNDAGLLREGMIAAERWKISLWDAMIVAAAKRASAAILWTEDLSEGQDYDGVVVINPLRERES